MGLFRTASYLTNSPMASHHLPVMPPYPSAHPNFRAYLTKLPRLPIYSSSFAYVFLKLSLSFYKLSLSLYKPNLSFYKLRLSL